MIRYIKVKEVPGRCTHIRVELRYNKLCGYCAMTDAVILQDHCVQQIYDAEYFGKYKSCMTVLVEAGRRSAKREAEAKAMLEVNARLYAENYAQVVNNRGGSLIIDDQ